MNMSEWIGIAIMIILFWTCALIVIEVQKTTITEYELKCVDDLVKSNLIAHYQGDETRTEYYINIKVQEYDKCFNITFINKFYTKGTPDDE